MLPPTPSLCPALPSCPSQGWLLANPKTRGPCTRPPTSLCTQLLSPSWSPQSWQFRAGGTSSKYRVSPTAMTLARPLSPPAYPQISRGNDAVALPWRSPPARSRTLRCAHAPLPHGLPQTRPSLVDASPESPGTMLSPPPAGSQLRAIAAPAHTHTHGCPWATPATLRGFLTCRVSGDFPLPPRVP